MLAQIKKSETKKAVGSGTKVATDLARLMPKPQNLKSVNF